MFSSKPSASGLAIAGALLFAGACADLSCPEGTYQVGKICRHVDSGVDPASAREAGADTDDADSGEAGTDSGTASSAADAASGDSQMTPEAGTDAAAPTMDSATATGTDASSAVDAGPPPAAPECDATHACAPGLVCNATKCVSACTQTQCDANATCSLIANAPVCTCNRGFIAMTGTGGAVTCLRDVACEELGCDMNATCVVTNQIRNCACKNGYTGDGKTCTPVSCPMPSLANGTVSTPDGLTFGKTASYRCNSGYDFPAGASSVTRSCGADMSWGIAVPACAPKNCGALTVANGTADTSRGTTYGSPSATFSCQSSFSRLGPATADCQANGTWTAAPTCWKCGDGVVTAGVEACDPSAPGSSVWSCNPSSCQQDTQTVYRACGSSAECGAGQSCSSGFCVRTSYCSQDSECPAVPIGSGAIAKCRGVGAGICVANCTSASQCAPGLTCAASGICTGCSTENLCQSPNPICENYPGESFGRCRR